MTGDQLRMMQRDLNFSNQMMCRALGVTEQSLCAWKSGRTKVPNPAALAVRMLAHYKQDIRIWLDKNAQ